MIKMILAAVVASAFLMSTTPVRADDKPSGDKAEKADKGKKEKKEGKKEGGGGW
jgi:hypothetical protein